MTHEEKRVYLIKRLLAEDSQYQGVVIPNTQENQEDLLRSLMNVRPPMPVNEEFLKLQDEYLGEESEQRGVVDGRTLPPVQPGGRMVLWQGDITTLKADAIVNAANSALLGCFQPLHSCIDNLIHSRSGIQLRMACDRLMREQGHEEEVGKAKITPAFNLPARYVLHCGSGRLWQGHGAGLRSVGLLLPLVPGTCRRKWMQEHRVLLHFHRGLSFSQQKSGRNRRHSSQRLSGG